MTVKRVRARNAVAARRKSTTKNVSVGSVNYITGTKKSGMRTYSVRTHKKK